MATRKASTTEVPSPLQLVTNAAFAAAKSTHMLKSVFIAAGGNQDAPRQALIVGRLMFALSYTQEKALLVLGKSGAKSNVAADDKRTEKEEKAYGAARVYLSARLKEWGLSTTSTQGGDRTKDDSKMSTEKLVMAKAPKVETVAELSAYASAYAKAGYDFFLLNKAHSAVISTHGSELMGAFADFVNSIAEINAKHAK